ncbi:response regulator [Paenibacillus methanolicus]|uniref:YesN/AraC family two-component response regulator n=1 Tax=Paenibacillus methanolicus TaxID=582686 RepID=A0A5S5CHF1_9BACL|nr:response regulator [Paenibacillus methanolicus]TYP78964.1 YesN/AraC family two-component response regulator [Paenibacillus methanolicus]
MAKLLIVEDNDFERNAMQHYIDWDILGIREVETAFNGLDGLEKASAFMPDIVISDVMMPGMNGIEMAKNIMRMSPQTKFVFSSGHEDVRLLQEAMEVRAYHYLIKPLKQEELIRVIKKTTSILVDEKLSSIAHDKVVEQFRANLRYLQSRFLEDVLVSGRTADDTKSLLVQARDLQLNMIGMYKLVLAELEFGDDADVFRCSDALQLVLHQLESVCNPKHAIVAKSSGNAIIVLLHSLVSGEQEETRIIDAVDREIRTLSEHGGFKFMIGVSGRFANMEELPVAYRQSRAAAGRKINLGYGQLVYYSEEAESREGWYELQPQDSKSVIARIIDAAMEGEYAEEELDRLVACARTDSSPSMARLQSSFILLFSGLNMQLAGAGESLDKMAEEEQSIYEHLLQAKTIPDMKQYTNKIFASISSYMERKKRNKDDYIINEILTILNQEYRHPITLASLSDRVYLSPNYLRILFKDKMKISIQEYLTNLRLSKAKELLKQTRHKIHEIGEMVGYENSTYFNIVFKNYMKMTPGEYRNKFK